MDIFATTTVPMPAPDLPIDMFSPLPASQWLNPLPMTSSYGSSCQQPPSPLQLSSPCTPSGSNSRSSGYASTPGSFSVDPYYGQSMQDNYQQIFDDYQSVSYQPTSPFFTYGMTPETNIGRFLSEFSNCLKQATDKEFTACQEMWQRFVSEFFEDSILFSVETIGGTEKQRYALSREHIPGYFHTYAEAGMSNIQCALGEGHMTRHDELLRMEYCNAACMMDCVKPNSFKAVREGRLLVDMKADDCLKMTFWYFKINKYNEFVLRDAPHGKGEQNASVRAAYGLPPGANAYLKKHGQFKSDCLNELLLSPASTNTTPTFVTPDNNWLLGADPFTGYDDTCATYNNMAPKMLPAFQPFSSDHLNLTSSSNDQFVPPKNPIKSRPSSWSTPSNKHDSKLKKQRSSGPKGKKRHRHAPIIMYIAGDPLTLHRDGRLLKNITDTQERKITCIKNTFESLRSDQEPKRLTPSVTKIPRISKPTLKINTNLSKSVTSFQNTLLSSSSSSWTDTLKLLNNNDIKLDQRPLCV